LPTLQMLLPLERRGNGPLANHQRFGKLLNVTCTFGLLVLDVQNVLTKLFQRVHFVVLLRVTVMVIFIPGGRIAYSKGGGHGGGHGGHSGGHASHSGGHAGHSGHHGEHHGGHIADHGHFQHFHGIHHFVHHRFGGGSYCLTNFYYDETGRRHCCDTLGQPCFPSPVSQPIEKPAVEELSE